MYGSFCYVYMYRAIMIKRTSDGNVVKKENLSWTNKRDNALIEALVNKHEIGNRVNGTSTSEVYVNMIAVMSKEFNKSFAKKII